MEPGDDGRHFHIPLSEHDTARPAFIEPTATIAPRDVPRPCVVTFFGDVVDRLVERRGARVLAENRWEDGPHPLLEIEHDGERLAVLRSGVGAPLAGGLLEEVIAMGCRAFVVCGGAGSLRGEQTLGHLVVVSSAIRDEGTSSSPLALKSTPTAKVVGMTMDMAGAPMWDARYTTPEYVFGREPAAFLTRCAGHLTPGSDTLVVADGEGRNSVHLASVGLQVTAMDISEVGVAKARRLAAERGVPVDFRIADVLAWEWAPDTYDLVVGVFIQFLDPQQRASVFAGMQRTLRQGGRLLLHGYRVEQLAYGTGGPRVPSHLYDERLLRDSFAAMDIDVLESYDTELVEGPGHAGMSALIDLVATKR